MTVLERMKKVVLAELTDVREEQITMEAHFRNDLNADSMELFDLILALEDEFGVTVSDEEAIMIHTVGDAVNYVKKTTGEE